jgi:hypothetical protein
MEAQAPAPSAQPAVGYYPQQPMQQYQPALQYQPLPQAQYQVPYPPQCGPAILQGQYQPQYQYQPPQHSMQLQQFGPLMAHQPAYQPMPPPGFAHQMQAPAPAPYPAPAPAPVPAPVPAPAIAPGQAPAGAPEPVPAPAQLPAAIQPVEPMAIEEAARQDILAGFPDLNSPSQGQYNATGQLRRSYQEAASRNGRSKLITPKSSSRDSSPWLLAKKKSKKGKLVGQVKPASIMELGRFVTQPSGEIIFVDPETNEECKFTPQRKVHMHSKLKLCNLHPTGSICIVESLDQPDLPRPQKDMCHALRSNHGMCLPPTLRTILHSHHTPCDCLAITLLDTNHRQNVIPLFCTKRMALARQELEVPQSSDIPRYYENSSRSFIYSDELRNHILAVPQPFAVSVRWPAIPFLPGLATCSSPRQIRNFFALFSAEEYRTAAACYLQPPDRWSAETNPYYSEPTPDSELYNLTKEVYGVETLFRTSLIRHPCRVVNLKVYVATDKHLQTPVITSSNKFMLDDVIAHALKPFYQAGEGQALCAVCLCLVQKNSDITVPAFFSRTDFINHYREVHWDHSIVTGLHVPTQLNSRVYQTHLLYTLCLGSTPVAENPQGQAIHGLATFVGLELCDILKQIIPSRPSSGPVPAVAQPSGPAPAPQLFAAGPSQAGNSLASSEQISELVDICQELQKNNNNTGAKKKR